MHARIGSISHATLNPEHLIPAFADELEALAKRDRDSSRRRAALLAVAEARAVPADDAAASEALEGLSNQLDCYAPPYAYFGSIEGDGSDFGFWPAIGSLEEDVRYGDGSVIKVDAGDPWPSGLRKDGTRFVMEVNDHGNVSLRYASNGREVWSVV